MDSIPTHSIFEVLRCLYKANKYSEINLSNYWTLYNNIRKNNLPDDKSIKEIKYELQHYHSSFNLEKSKTPEIQHKTIVFADFEATTDGYCHKEFCICARKYNVTIKTELREVSEFNMIPIKNFNISDEFEAFEKYSKDCAIEFLDWIDSGATVFFHNLTYDINFLLKHVNNFKSSIIFHGRDMMHSVIYKGKQITFKSSLAMTNTKHSVSPHDCCNTTRAFQGSGTLKKLLIS